MNPLRVFRRSPESAESRIKELETKLDNVLKLVRDGAQTSLENQLQDSVDQKRFLDDAESSVKLLLQGYWKSLNTSENKETTFLKRKEIDSSWKGG